MGEAHLRARSEQYRNQGDRVTDAIVKQGGLFDQTPSTMTTTVTGDLLVDDCKAGDEVIIVFSGDDTVRVFQGQRAVARLDGRDATAATRHADGRSPVVGRLETVDTLVGVVQVCLSRPKGPL